MSDVLAALQARRLARRRAAQKALPAPADQTPPHARELPSTGLVPRPAAPERKPRPDPRGKWAPVSREARQAHKAVERAVRTGKLRRPDKCEACGEKRRVQAHHPDYARRLDVEWLCRECHDRADGKVG